MHNPTHRHKESGSLVYPTGYDASELELLPDSFWDSVLAENVLLGIKSKRNKLLADCDHMVLPDRDLPPEEYEAWKAYRKALRDITKGNTQNIKNVIWPKEPSK